MLDIALASLRTQARRFIAPGLAILLGVAFLTTSLVLGTTAVKGLSDSIAGAGAGFSAVISPPSREVGIMPASTLAKVEAVPGVQDVHEVRFAAVRPSGDSSRVVFLTTPPAAGSRSHLVAGRLPASDSEVAITSTTRDSKNLRIGDHVDYAGADGPHRFTVVGVIDTAGDFVFSGGGTYAFTTSAAVAAVSGEDDFAELDVTATAGTDPKTLVAALNTALGDTAMARTGADHAAYLRAQVTGGTDVLRLLLLGFAGIALFVSALVIANTFAILAARRTRETALLRCVGATRRQLLRAMSLEALVVGFAASLAGVATGAALAWAGMRTLAAFDSTEALAGSGLVVRPLDLLGPLLVGTGVTVLASLAPLRRATQVTPLAALRPDLGAPARARTSGSRLGIGGTAALAGAGLLAFGGARHQLLAGLIGGAVSFVGVVLLARVFVPALIRGLGSPVQRLAGVPGELAVDNAVRNRSRTANTATALLVGVTLISTMTVGAATLLRSVDTLLDHKMAVDVVASALPDAALPARVEPLIAAVSGVAETTTLLGAHATVGSLEMDVRGIDVAEVDVIHDDAITSALRSGRAFVSPGVAKDAGVKAGERVRFSGDKGSADLIVEMADNLPAAVLMPLSELRSIASAPGPIAVLARLDTGADSGALMADLESALATTPGVTVSGTAQQRQEFVDILDTVLAVAAALLAVAIVIAVVGVANTLSLSVLERGQEHALLRALGLTRRQLRRAVAVEAGLIALVGALVGVALGIGYGWAGAHTIAGAEMTVSLGMPWPRLVLIAAAALAAGLLASLLPARRASRTAPAIALAQE